MQTGKSWQMAEKYRVGYGEKAACASGILLLKQTSLMQRTLVTKQEAAMGNKWSWNEFLYASHRVNESKNNNNSKDSHTFAWIPPTQVATVPAVKSIFQ